MFKKIIVIFSVLLIQGCKIKDAEEPVTEKVQEKNNVTNTLKQTEYKGMYSFSDKTGKFTECDSKKKFILSPFGANRNLDSVFSTYNGSRAKRKIYITAEGFSTVQQKKTGKDFDTVLVITKIIGTDSTINCDKQNFD